MFQEEKDASDGSFAYYTEQNKKWVKNKKDPGNGSFLRK